MEQQENRAHIVEFADGENKSFFAVSMLVELNNKKFALLSEVEMKDGIAQMIDSPDTFVARIDIAEDGLDVFVEPTEEEFVELMNNIEELQEQPAAK